MRRTSRAIRRADRTLAPFQKRRHHSALFALHGVGVGGYDRVCRRDVYHCEAAGLQKDAACIAGRHRRKCDFWRAAPPTRLALTGYLRMSRACCLAIALIAFISYAHADEQNRTVQTDTSPIENPRCRVRNRHCLTLSTTLLR